MLSEKKKNDDVRALSAAKSYLDATGLGHLSSLIVSFVKNYAAAKSHNHDGVYAKSSHAHTITQVTDLQSQLDSKQPKGSYALTNHTHDASNITSGTVSTDRLPLMPVSKGGTGHTNLADSANSMIDSLTVGAVTPSDNDYVISQVVDSGVAHKKPMSSLWVWIKSKCDALYQAKGSYASSSHTHSWSQITGKPSIPSALTYMPVGYVYISWSSTSPAYMFGGSWTAITGRFPYFNAGTGTGGSNQHVHNFDMHYFPYYGGLGCGWNEQVDETFIDFKKEISVRKSNPTDNRYVNSAIASSTTLRKTVAIDKTIETTSSNNMPSYQTLYAWRRTA